MAIVHVRTGGTKEATGSGDYASTADDWTLANCYDNILQVGQNNQTGSPADYIVAGDEVIFYSVAVGVTTHTMPAGSSLNSLQSGGVITLKSRLGIGSDCVLSSASNNTQLQINLATTETAFTFEDITFTSSIVYSDANEALFYFRGECGDLIFNRVVWQDYTTTAPANNNGLSALIYSRFTGTLKDRDITFNSCQWNNIDLTYENGGYFIRIDGAAAASESGVLNINGVCSSNDCSFTAYGSDSGDDIAGHFFIEDSIVVNLNGSLTFNDYASSQVSQTGEHWGCFYCLGTLNGSAGDITANRCTTTGGRTRALVVHAHGAYTLNKVEANDCVSFWGDTVDGTTGIAFLAQTAATGTVNHIKTTRCKSRTGVAGYSSNGGVLHVKRVEAYDCEAVVGVVYGGGHGNFTVDSALITGSRIYEDNFIGSETTANVDGLDLNSFINPTTGAANKTTALSNITVLDSDVRARSSVSIRNSHTTYDHTVTVDNCFFNGGAIIELEIDGATSATLDVTMQNVAVQTALLDETILTGTFTNTDPITDVLVVPSDGDVSGTVLQAGGIMWWTSTDGRPSDAIGEPLPDSDVSVGGVQSKAIPFHPTQL